VFFLLAVFGGGALSAALAPMGLGMLGYEPFYGIWFMAPVFTLYLIRKPGIGIITEIIAAVIEVLLGNMFGIIVVVSAFIQGLGIEIAFMTKKYGDITYGTTMLGAVITTIFTINFLRSPIGRSTLSVREDEIAAESVGINTTKVKVIAFVFGAITAAIAGSLQAGFIGSVVPKDYSFTNTINVLIIVVFGGLGSMSGTVVAAIVLGILNMVLQDFSSVRMIIYSLALILVMIFRPGGLLGTWEFSLKKLLSKKEAN